MPSKIGARKLVENLGRTEENLGRTEVTPRYLYVFEEKNRLK
jgi:hypothetical protein